MKIYDCCLYNGEDTLLDIRLNELDSFVDVFVIVECIVSFSGEQKGYRFHLEKFNKFSNKIRYIKIEDGIADYKDKSYWNSFQADKWKREFYLRNSIIRGLYDAEPDDIILLSDVDEIPILEKINKNKELFVFKQICLQFKFNLMNEGMTPFYGTHGVKFKYLGMPSELRLHSWSHLGITYYDKLDAQKIISGGWHFSFCLPIEKILEKIRFYSHCERNNEVAVTKEYIENCILNKTDIWNGEYNYAKKSNKLINFSIDKLPKYIRNNIKRFENYLDL
jgi:beta-1,4-mannosyl-glycoprotein beta-1,4-N-acetylglucosaminyltransferase